jgi:enoyl-CoA hydratase/carnithine racemase
MGSTNPLVAGARYGSGPSRREVIQPGIFAALFSNPCSSCFRSASQDAINMSLQTNLVEDLEYESEIFAQCFSIVDQMDGVKAFLEKRKPEFIGR